MLATYLSYGCTVHWEAKRSYHRTLWRGRGIDGTPSAWTDWLLSAKYDLHHCRAGPVTPMDSSSLVISLPCSTLSNAVNWSSKTRKKNWPLSTDCKMSLWSSQKCNLCAMVHSICLLVVFMKMMLTYMSVQPFNHYLLDEFWEKWEFGYGPVFFKIFTI